LNVDGVDGLVYVSQIRVIRCQCDVKLDQGQRGRRLQRRCG